MIVLGIDPGLASMGWGVVEMASTSRALNSIGYGTIHTTAEDGIAQRLLKLFEGVGCLIEKYNPDEMAIEEIFFSKNVKTAVVVAQSKGAALTAAGLASVPCFEYSPPQIKLALSGYGKGTKDQIQKMVQRLLRLDKIPRPNHAADALAVAVTHINSRRVERKISSQK